MLRQLTSYWKLHKLSMLMVLISAIFYYVLAYESDRSDFPKILALYAGLFILCFKLIQFEKWNHKLLVVAGILLRLVFLLAEPNLSQDYLRFIWDGRLVAMGVNPYLMSPNEIIEAGELLLPQAEFLQEGMGKLSARNYSNYPPLNQFMFGLAALLGGSSLLGTVVVMRLQLILADIGIYYFGRKLLKNMNRSPYLIFWYFLNPLVIIECTGNLHYEALMLFFFVLAFFLLSRKKPGWAALAFAASIGVKLIPLLFLPLFIGYFGFRKSLRFYLITGLTGILMVLPFYHPDFIGNYLTTIRLWYSNFEFNAGIYNGLKHLSAQYEVKPWKLIKTYGKIAQVLTLTAAIGLAFLSKKDQLQRLFILMLWLLTLHFGLASVVHPWYIVFLLLLTLYTDYRFPLWWSALVFLSYSAYSGDTYQEQLWLLAIEYLVVFGFMLYEIFRIDGQKLAIRKN